MPDTYHRGLRIMTGRSARLPGDYSPDPTGAREPPPGGRPTRDFDPLPAREADPAPGGLWTMRILDWMPTPLNRLLGQHWGKASRCKRDDAAEIRIAMASQHVPPATTKRRLTVLVVLPPKRRAPDPDALTKSLADALVHAGALKNDSHLWVEHGPVQFARGQRLTTFVTLETL